MLYKFSTLQTFKVKEFGSSQRVNKGQSDLELRFSESASLKNSIKNWAIPKYYKD